MDAANAGALEGAPAEAETGGGSAAGIWLLGVVAGLGWLLAAVVTHRWPDINEWTYTERLAEIQAVFGAVLLAVGLGSRWLGRVGVAVRPAGAWLAALAVAASVWQIVTAKTLLLPPPFFTPPQGILEAYLDDWPRLLECAYHSVILLGTGYVFGATVGFVYGVAIGWSKAAAYWGQPVLRLIGPLPPTAWLPVAFFLAPTSWSASVFLIALATGIPVAILTWSGVASVPSSYYDIARTLGGKQRFLILKVAVPAAMPHVFVGLFMGMSASFVVLVVAEMMGVKAGLGWYLQWAQGWAAYGNMYAALLVMAVVCSGSVSLLFKLRNRLLSWQKGMVRW